MFNDFPIQICQLVLTLPTTHIEIDIDTSLHCLTFHFKDADVN